MRAVEDGLTLRSAVIAVGVRAALRAALPVRGTLVWSRVGEGSVVGRIGYTTGPSPAESGGRVVVLLYTLSGGRWPEPLDVRLPVRLSSVRTNLGGTRHYFRCPGVSEGAGCGRRCAKLYLPCGSARFACRTCHRLTYRTRQESRRYDSLYRRLAQETGLPVPMVKRALKR